jgi:hypothetical protein
VRRDPPERQRDRAAYAQTFPFQAGRGRQVAWSARRDDRRPVVTLLRLPAIAQRAGGPTVRERRSDEIVVATGRHLDERGPCEDRPHVLSAAAAPLSLDVIDELHRWMSTGREAHLVLTVPRSPASRDAALHALWERRLALDVADRLREVAQLWPGSRLVRIEVVGEDVAPAHRRRWRR